MPSSRIRRISIRTRSVVCMCPCQQYGGVCCRALSEVMPGPKNTPDLDGLTAGGRAVGAGVWRAAAGAAAVAYPRALGRRAAPLLCGAHVDTHNDGGYVSCPPPLTRQLSVLNHVAMKHKGRRHIAARTMPHKPSSCCSPSHQSSHPARRPRSHGTPDMCLFPCRCRLCTRSYLPRKARTHRRAADDS